MEEISLYQKFKKEAGIRWNSLAKPLYGFGVLEDAVTKLVAIRESMEIAAPLKKAVVVLAADHGVVEEGVTQADASVTRTVAESIAAGEAVISILAASVGADTYIFDVGMDTEPYPEREIRVGAVIDRKIARGAGNLRHKASMTEEDVSTAFSIGREILDFMSGKGYEIVATGEMGIGNTTPATAIAAYLLHLDPKEVTGRGAGLDDEGLKKKIRVVEDAILRVRTSHPEGISETELLAELGGYEIAVMTGIFLAAKEYRMPVVVDGAISAVAALLAVRIDARSADYMLASHMPAEGVGADVTAAMHLEPVIHGRLCHGEGTGATLLFPLLDAALEVFCKTKTFAGLGIEAYKEEGKPGDKR